MFFIDFHRFPSVFFFTDFYSFYLLWNKKICSLKDNLNKLLKITPEEIKHISNEIFKKENMVISYSGKENLNSKINEIVNEF